jgi:hypothetical protein
MMHRGIMSLQTMRLFLLAAVLGTATLCASAAAVLPQDLAMPHYAHIFVIVEENKDYDEVIGNPAAPHLNALAREYGNATQFYAETHPSEPNYVAMVGGDTFGIQDDAPHTIDAPSIATQLEAAGLTWKDYLESIPSPGSLATSAENFYASKHSGFVDFLSVQRDPNRSQELVGFDRFYADLKAGDVPNLAFVVPNLCNEMHGAGLSAPEDCQFLHFGHLVSRGDEHAAEIVSSIMDSPVWRAAGNAAIVITFDEDGSHGTQGCCGNDPANPANRGGGRIPTIVITNHGPRHVTDATPYSHYSLLRTIEDAFGIDTYLRRADAPGVVPMLPLFRTS